MLLPPLHDRLAGTVATDLRSGTSVMLSGLPGSGRTTVLGRVTDLLQDEGYRTLRVRGARALRDRELEALAVSELGALRPPRGASLLATYVSAIERLAERESFVLVVEEADDLDAASVGAVVAAWGTHRFPVLASTRPRFRPGEDLSLASAVVPAMQVPVPTLTYDGSARLMEEVLGDPVEAATAGTVHARAGGMPGLVETVTRSARRAERLVRVDGAWRARGDLWTPEVGAVVDRLAAGLDAQHLHALGVLSLAGAVMPATAGRLVGWGVLEELDGAGLLRTAVQGNQELVGVYPPLIADHLLHAAPHTSRLRLTAEITEALGADPDGTTAMSLASTVRGVHAGDALGTPRGRERAAVLNRHLTDHLARRRAVRATEWAADPTPATAVRYLETLMLADQDEATAAAVVAGTPERGEPDEIAVLRYLAAVRIAYAQHDVDRAHAALLRPLPAELVAEVPEIEQTLVALDRRLTLMLERVPQDVDVEPGTRVGDGIVEVVRIESLLAQGRSLDALALLDRRADDDPLLDRPRQVARGLALLLAGRVHEADDWTRRRIEEATANHDVDGLWAHCYTRAVVLGTLGRFSELGEQVSGVLALGMIPVRQAHLAVGVLSLGAYVALRQGRFDAARTLARQAEGIHPVPGPWPFMSIGWFDAAADAFAAGDLEAQGEAFWAEACRLADRGYAVAAAVMGVLALESVPDPDRAAQVAGFVSGAQGESPADLSRLAAVLVDGSAASALDLADDAAARGSLLAATRALVHAVRRLRAADEDARAEQVVDDVRAADRLGADMLAVLVGGDLVDELTPREGEVVGLVDAGLTNQQIAHRLLISVSTVENHLNRVYRKLKVAGRSGLVSLLHERRGG